MVEKALVIAPHADDEAFGCGGTIAKLVDEDMEVDLVICTLGSDAKSFIARNKNLEKSNQILGISNWSILTRYREGHLDLMDKYALTSAIENETKKGYEVIFIPYPSHHQDHIAVNQACIAALRPGVAQPDLILMYEYTYPTWVVPDQYNGKLFVDISDTMSKKIKSLHAYEPYLRGSMTPISERSVTIMAETRGLSIGVPFAEMFYVIQIKNIL